ncbi:MAG: DUF2064 domain-containing protein [Saprospiraceae bacterium]|nr:DUF2064 domain-containing protein [Saprospiraceae bacterium]MCB9326868.1 DUF2064 domain-containing protein [Lewinellaceae bacterium]
MQSGTNTALLIFSRQARAEAEVKSFVPTMGKKGNTSIAQKLIRKSISTARKTRLPFFTCYDTAQHGDTFGERMANAIEGIYAKGYQNVIVLGNDCPGMDHLDLLSVPNKLESHPLVMGPATDGGLYLIGMRQDSYQRQAFIDLPWETSQLQSGLIQYAETSSNAIFWLKVQQDIDNAADFNTLLTCLPGIDPLRQQFISIINSFQTVSRTTNTLGVFLKYLLYNGPLRAPPLA